MKIFAIALFSLFFLFPRGNEPIASMLAWIFGDATRVKYPLLAAGISFYMQRVRLLFLALPPPAPEQLPRSL